MFCCGYSSGCPQPCKKGRGSGRATAPPQAWAACFLRCPQRTLFYGANMPKNPADTPRYSPSPSARGIALQKHTQHDGCGQGTGPTSHRALPPPETRRKQKRSPELLFPLRLPLRPLPLYQGQRDTKYVVPSKSPKSCMT